MTSFVLNKNIPPCGNCHDCMKCKNKHNGSSCKSCEYCYLCHIFQSQFHPLNKFVVRSTDEF